MRPSVIFRSVQWQSCTEVSGQPIGPIFRGQEFQEESREELSIRLTNSKGLITRSAFPLQDISDICGLHDGEY